MGIKFIVVTDNVANTYFKTQRKLSLKQFQWQGFIGEFDFEWIHRPGRYNDVVDTLSQKVVEDPLSDPQAPYWMPPWLVELRMQLDELSKPGLVQSSKSPYGSPFLFQKKQVSLLRFCVDYRTLDKVTIKNKYPIPNSLDLFKKLTRARFYTKIDLRSG